MIGASHLNVNLIAGHTLARAGIDARWVDCPASEAKLDNYPDCQLPSCGATDFVLKVLPKTMEGSRAKWRDSMGFSLLCEPLGTCSASVFYGRAMAHEIGHLILGTNSHSPTGIMRASWRSKDL